MLEVYLSSRSIVYLSRLTHTPEYCNSNCVCMDAASRAQRPPVGMRGRTAGFVGKRKADVREERERERVKTKEDVVFCCNLEEQGKGGATFTFIRGARLASTHMT